MMMTKKLSQIKKQALINKAKELKKKEKYKILFLDGDLEVNSKIHTRSTSKGFVYFESDTDKILLLKGNKINVGKIEKEMLKSFQFYFWFNCFGMRDCVLFRTYLNNSYVLRDGLYYEAYYL